MTITNNCESFSNCTDNENDAFNIFIKTLPLSIPSRISTILLFLISLKILVND